ncbi:MAG TPA: hypothetical protein VFG52_10555 [Xanthomonadales bacterium]|nr:hypothetical protein [Xanthomonadales bacterium]
MLIFIPDAQASQCVGHSDIWGYVEEAEYIFSAQIIAISSEQLERRPVAEEKSFMTPSRLEMQFDPIRVLKGNIDELTELVTWTGIGMDLHVGQDYYFFVKGDGEVTRCSATYELSRMTDGDRAEFLAKAGFRSPESVESFRQWEAYRNWKNDLWERLNASDEPWLWALYLNQLQSLAYGHEVFEFAARQTVNKILAHPAPGAETLYWAGFFCLQTNNSNNFCRTGELLDRLFEADSNNLAVMGFLAVADNMGIARTTSQNSQVLKFDEWLEQVEPLNRVETYQYAHFADLAQRLTEYGEQHGFYSSLKDAPLQWRVINYIFDEAVYPETAGGVFHHDCAESAFVGNADAVTACRSLAELRLAASTSFRSRQLAYSLKADTYPKDDARYIRFLREGNAWNGPVAKCLNRLHEYEGISWTITADAGMFMKDFEASGEIAAFQKLAQAEGWKYSAPDGKTYECEELPTLPDAELESILGYQDPAVFKCSPGDGCYPDRAAK